MLEISATQVEPGVGVITPVGRFTIRTLGDSLDLKLQELLDQGCKTIVVDLGGVTHLDSTGIGKFIQSLNLVMASGGRLLMAAAQPAIRESFRVTRLDTVFQFLPTLEEALSKAADKTN